MNNGVCRRSWAGNENAIFAIQRAMAAEPQLKVTVPQIADGDLIASLSSSQ